MIEVVKTAMRQNKEGYYITLFVHPNDEAEAKRASGLIDGHCGQRYYLDYRRAEEGEDDGYREASEMDRSDAQNSDTSPRVGSGDALANDHKSARRELTEGERLRTRAVLLCKDERFQEWIAELHNADTHEEVAAYWVRELCGIDSRSELALSIPAQEKFRNLERQFREETGQAAERRGG